MSSFDQTYVNGANIADDWAAWFPDLKKSYPSLAEALVGQDGWEKDKSLRPALSLIITVRDGRLRYSLSNPEADRGYHGAITPGLPLLDAIEASLRNNAGEWVKKRKDSGRQGSRF